MKMELKVWVEGLQRIVCGVNAATTCQDVVYALAHATGQTGRFTLVERWRSNERVLAPHDRPLKVLAKWGEYASDVHFILRKSPAVPVSPPTAKVNQPKEAAVKKSLTFSGGRVKKDEESVTLSTSNGSGPVGNQNSLANPVPAHYIPPRAQTSSQAGNQMKPMSPPPYRSPPSVQRTSVGMRSPRDGDVRNDVHVVYDARYRDLVRLVNMQKETLNSQQAQLTQYDAEIGYWEENHKDQVRRIELIDSEMRRLEINNQDATEEELTLDPWHLNDELERGIQQERTLHSDLQILRNKLAQCENELFQCRNKIRSLLDELSEERERNMLNDIENLRQEIAEKLREYDSRVAPIDVLAAEVEQIETAIAHKRNEVDSMVRQIKEANLQSLSISAGADDVKHLDGGAFGRPSSTRRMVGSPRQLENAVPTSKNPHGIWV